MLGMCVKLIIITRVCKIVYIYVLLEINQPAGMQCLLVP